MAALGTGTVRDLIGRIGRFRTTTVLAPLYVPLIISGVLASFVTPFAGVDHPLTWMLWIVFVVLVGIAGLFYCIWSVANPDRLQTEEYRLEEQRMRIIGDESRPGAGAVVIDSAPLTSNTGPTK
jgi:hypothetical protein